MKGHRTLQTHSQDVTSVGIDHLAEQLGAPSNVVVNIPAAVDQYVVAHTDCLLTWPKTRSWGEQSA